VADSPVALGSLPFAKFPPPGSPQPYTANESRPPTMPVAQLTLEIRIDHAQSLKDRRHVVRSLKDQLRQAFNVSVAEMDEATLWNSATLGIVAVSRSRDYLHGLMDEIERAARRMTAELSAELADAFWDYIEG
jgi:uncharacterized protein YlxP (DUF503 family)